MLRVPVHKIEPGMILARPVPLPSDPHHYLLQRDREIPTDLIPRLKQLGVMEVWVRCRDLDFLEDVFDEGLGDRQREVYGHVRRNFEAMLSGTSALLDISSYQHSISDLFGYLRESQTGNVLLEKLDAFDNYLMSHSTNVCYLSMLLGMKLERYLIDERRVKTPRDAKDLKELGLGCLLHDVGKMKVPPEILNKPGKLTDEEMQIMRLHPVYGYEMIKGRVSSNAAQVVLNHHQRYNGEGYPDRVDASTGNRLPPLAGKSIPVFVRMSTICDVYDAATTKRIYSEAKLPVQVLHEMKTWCDGFFDPIVARAFYDIVPPFPIGQVVKLSNGVEAAVIDFNPRHAERPKVQGLRDPYGHPFDDPSREEIDLAISTDLSIQSVGDVDVTPFLESQRQPSLLAGSC